MEYLEKISRRLNQAMAVIAGVALAAMIALTVGNIWSRTLFAPIKGTVELIGFFGAIAAAFTLGFSQLHNAHTAVDILVLKFPKRTQKLLKGFNALVGAAFFGVAGWQLIRWGTTLWQTGELTETLRIIYHPVVWAVAAGCFVMALVQLLQAFKTFIAPNGDK
jgi:TRAP-type C4-dicarboxylate transport system permease small subunit